MNIALNKEYRKLLEDYSVNLALLLYLFRSAIPLLKFPFIVIYSLLFTYILIVYRRRIFSSIIEFGRSYYLVIVLTVILLIAFLFSNKLYLVVFKDVVNSFILLTFLFVMTIKIDSEKDLSQFMRILVKLIIIFALFISFVRLLDLLNILPESEKAVLYQIPYTIEVASLPIDYNFAILPVIFGMIGVIYFLVENIKFGRRVLYNIVLIIFSLSIFFAGSRRGIILFSGILLVLAVFQLLSFLRNETLLRRIAVRVRSFLISLFLVSVALWAVTYTSYIFKNKTLEYLGTRNLVGTKGEIALIIYRYYSVINNSITYPEIYNGIWTPVFDPLDPDSGWGSRMHKIVYPLTGKNVDMVPAGSKGYFMDETSNADTLGGSAYSSTWISNHDVKEGQILDASVFCYVSDSCSVSMVEICSLGAMGNPGSLYDLSNKGKWQKLSFRVDCKDGNAGVLLFFSKSEANDFSTLNGHIIFAYPQINIINKNEIGKSVFLDGKIICPKNSHKTLITSNTIDSSENIFIPFPSFEKHFHAGLFNISGLNKIKSFNQSVDKDPVRQWANKFISEDTSYYAFSSDLRVDDLSGNIIKGRTMRWQFAWQIYTKEYSLYQKLTGDGFNFLNWFGFTFLKNKQLSDYPHNPILSVLLYSGLIGVIIYLIFLYKVFFFYYKYFKKYILITIFFLVTFFFSFFSAGSPLDPPIMGFFAILAFLFDNIHKKQYSTSQQ